MLVKLLAATLASCCLAIPVTFKVQELFERVPTLSTELLMSATRLHATRLYFEISMFLPCRVRRLIFEGGRRPLVVRILSEAFKAGTSPAPLPPVSSTFSRECRKTADSFWGVVGNCKLQPVHGRLWQTRTRMEFMQLCLLMAGPSVCQTFKMRCTTTR